MCNTKLMSPKALIRLGKKYFKALKHLNLCDCKNLRLKIPVRSEPIFHTCYFSSLLKSTNKRRNDKTLRDMAHRKIFTWNKINTTSVKEIKEIQAVHHPFT